MSVTGGCLCGAVRYTVERKPKEAGACHCQMCRKISGGVYIAFRLSESEVTFEGKDHIARYASSPWAERCFCKLCGGNLFYHVLADGPFKGNHHIGLGTLDDPSGVPMVSEIYIDQKPDSYAFTGDLHQMTQAEIEAMYAEYMPD